MKLIAICVSQEPQIFSFRIPFYNLASPEQADKRGTVKRAMLVAELRNRGMKNALQNYPDTTHVLMIDTYYLSQIEAVKRLVIDYERGSEKWILGASTWVNRRTDTLRPELRFYDSGSTPEADRILHREAGGIIPVETVGACYIFPVEAWIKNGYSCPPDHFEVEHKSLCKGFECFLDLDVKLYRPDRTDSEAIYPFRKALRCTLGKWRRGIIRDCYNVLPEGIRTKIGRKNHV